MNTKTPPGTRRRGLLTPHILTINAGFVLISSAGQHVWTAIGLIPGGKLAKAGKLLKIADDPADAGRRLFGACTHSFDPDTPVLMANGIPKRIKDIKIGDEVIATDPETGRTESHKVTQLHRNQDTDLVDLTIRTDDGATATIHTTSHHPFWNDSDNDWVNTADLAVGDRLRTPDTNDTITVEAVRAHAGGSVMNDLTIDQLHTYYVIAGVTPVLVHNTGSNCGMSVGGKIGDELGGQPFHASDYTLDEYVQFVNSHTGDGNPVMGRPNMTQVETTLRNSGPTQLSGQNASVFENNGVRVIINWNQPWKSTAYFPGS